MLAIQAISAFDDNYIWFIKDPASRKVLIVDPGDAEPVIHAIKQQQLIPIALLITHHHSDHIAGISRLLELYDIPVFGPKNERIPHITHFLTASDAVFIDPAFSSMKILDVPGHTQGHIAFLIDGNLFCGDTLFGAGCGRLLGGTARQLHTSLNLIATLPEDTNIFCAHEYTQSNLRFAAVVEPNNQALKQRITNTDCLIKNGKPSLPSTLALELQTNPFLRCQQADVIRAVERFSGQTSLNSCDVFTNLRLWKDKF